MFVSRHKSLLFIDELTTAKQSPLFVRSKSRDIQMPRSRRIDLYHHGDWQREQMPHGFLEGQEVGAYPLLLELTNAKGWGISWDICQEENDIRCSPWTETYIMTDPL